MPTLILTNLRNVLVSLCTNGWKPKTKNMSQQVVSPKQIMINNGVLLGGISVLIGVILYATNNHVQPHWSYAVVGSLIFIAIVVLGIKKFKEANGGFLSLGQALKIGIGIALISALFGLAWQLLMTNVLDPDYADKILDVQREQFLERQPDMSQEQLDKTMEMVSGFSSPIFGAAVQILGGLFFGFIVSLIAGLVMKKEDPYANIED